MRLRRKPWIDEAIHEYDSHIILSGQEQYKGKWRELFAHPERPLYMELGTGKGRFIAGMSEAYPDANFVGFEVQIGVIYYAAQKIYEAERDNAKVSLFDIAGIEEVVAPGEVDRFYRSKFLAHASLYSFKGDLLKIRELLDDVKSQLTHYNKIAKFNLKRRRCYGIKML